ncbi:hypothetical protein [Nocardia sp. MW-W600-9]
MSRNNDSLPMLPPWLSESEVTQVGYEAPVENLPQDDLIDEAPKRRRFMSRGGNDDAKKDKRGRRRKGEDQQPEQHRPEPVAEPQRPPAEPPTRQPGWPAETANPLIPGDQPNAGWQGGPTNPGPGTPPPWPQERAPRNATAAAVPPAPGPSTHAPTSDPSIPTGPTGAPFAHGPGAAPYVGPAGVHESSAAAYADPASQAGDPSGPALPTRTPAPPSTGFTPSARASSSVSSPTCRRPRPCRIRRRATGRPKRRRA